VAITINQTILKIVIDFTRPNTTETQIRNFLVNNIWPALEAKINNKMDRNFENGWTKEVKLSVWNIGGDNWQIYPKIIISGTTNHNATKIKFRMSVLLKELKTELKEQAASFGVTNMKFHIHYLDERAKESDDI